GCNDRWPGGRLADAPPYGGLALFHWAALGGGGGRRGDRPDDRGGVACPRDRDPVRDLGRSTAQGRACPPTHPRRDADDPRVLLPAAGVPALRRRRSRCPDRHPRVLAPTGDPPDG